MIDKIVLSSDRKSLMICFDTHNVGFYSDVDVLALMWEIVFLPSIRLEHRAEQKKLLLARSLEDTAEIDVSAIWDDVA